MYRCSQCGAEFEESIQLATHVRLIHKLGRTLVGSPTNEGVSPLPDLRPIGQQVVVTRDYKIGTKLIPGGIFTQIEGVQLDPLMYKIVYRRNYFWVTPDALETRS
jgi:hypothetical protein